GSEFVRMQNAGHINIDSGHGEWPLGWALLQSLEGGPAAHPLPASFAHPHDSIP
ncbi:MAG: alpha/beta hydrolase, partial [Acidovorax sp.]